jgi:hypothetical protein
MTTRIERSCRGADALVRACQAGYKPASGFQPLLSKSSVCSIFAQLLRSFPRAESEPGEKGHQAECHARGFASWRMPTRCARSARVWQRARESSNTWARSRAPIRSTLAHPNQHRPWSSESTGPVDTASEDQRRRFLRAAPPPDRKTGDRQRVSGKLRRKLEVCPLSPLSPPDVRN